MIVTKNSLHLPDDVRVVVSCWPLLFTWGGYHFCVHMISFRLAELIPNVNKSCSGDGLCHWLGRSDLHGSHVKMLLVGLLFPVAERDASYLHPHLPLFLPADTCTLWNVKKNNIMWKKNRLHRSWHFLQWLGVWRKISGSLNLRGSPSSFLGVLHQLLVLALLGVAPPPVVSSEKTSTSCPEC